MTTKESHVGKDSKERGLRDADTPHTDELRETLTEAGSNLRRAANTAMPAAREQWERVGDAVAHKTETLESSLIAHIREKPLNSVLLAAAIGMFAGLFLLRK